MRVRNLSTNPLYAATVSGGIVDITGWNLKGFNESLLPLYISVDLTLIEGTEGKISIGWTNKTLSASGRLGATIISPETRLPKVTLVANKGTWQATRLLATTAGEDAILQALDVDYFDYSSHPY